MWILLAASLASATEVANGANDGVGIAIGAPAFAFTYKHNFSQKHAVAAYVGRSIRWIPFDVRAEYNGELAELHDWVWGRLTLMWEGGLEFSLTDRYGNIGTRLGAVGGLGSTLQLHDFPLEAFVDISMGLYPLNNNCFDTLTAGSSCLVGRVDVKRFPSPVRIGARWYF